MSLILQFEHQYSNSTAEITAKIGRLPMLNGAERCDMIVNIDRMLSDVDELLDQMELTIREIPAGLERQKFDTRLKSYKADLKQLKNEFKNVAERHSDEHSLRKELFANSIQEYGALSEDQKSSLLNNTEKLERSSRKLKDGYKIAIETEQIGADVLNNLESQRNVLQRSRDRLREVDDDLSQSSHVLSKMIFKVIQNRLVLILIGGFLLIAITVAIYFTIRKHH